MYFAPASLPAFANLQQQHSHPDPVQQQHSYYHYQPQVSRQQQQQFEPYVPEPVHPLREALNTAERHKAKAEKLSSSLLRVLEIVVSETSSGGGSPMLQRLAHGGSHSVFEEVLAIQSEWSAAEVVKTQERERRALEAMHAAAAAANYHLPQHQHFDADINFFGTNVGSVYQDTDGQLCLSGLPIARQE